MRRALAILFLVSSSVFARADTLTYPDLVKRLTDMEGLAVLPPVGEKTALASSYDRSSQYDAAGDKYINWSANGDGGGIVREEAEGLVLADLKGPGCIWRIWSAAPRGGHVKIYLDGSTTPAIDRPFKDYFDRDHGPFPWKNICYLNAGEAPNPNEPGSNLYVPISFQKSCRIVGDRQKGPDEQTGWGAYYQFNYTTFPEGTVVPTFQLPFSPENKTALDEADRRLGQCGRDPAGSRPGEKTESKDLTLQPGAMATALDLQGAGAITALKIKVPLNQELDEEKKMLLRQLTIRISWDGEAKPSVWSPLGDFFATVGGAQPFATLPVGLQPDGTFYCYWYMPYGQSAKIELGNDGPDQVPVTLTVTHAPLDRPIADLARFHAKWHRDSAEPMRADRWPDWSFLTTQGRGRFVGMMLDAFVPVTIWWGEGDEKFFVDGEKFPSDFGTGTEDYFGYAWGAEGQFVRPFHAQPLNENNCNHVDDIRWHIAESVPFQAGFEADLEKYLYNDPMSVAQYPDGRKPKPTDPHALYAAEAYWYLAPGGTDPYEPVSVADRTKYWTSWAKYNEPDVIEGEWLKGVKHPDIREFCHMPYPAPTQQDAPDVFSGNRELLWGTDWGPDSHERMEVNIPVKKTGRYQVLVRLAKGSQCGILQLTFEDKDRPLIDCYAPQAGAMDPIDIGTYDLDAGDHPLDFMVAGSNPAGSKKLLLYGLDYVKLVPVPETQPRHARVTGADDSSIHSITAGDPHPVDKNNGDTWDFAWTPQGTLYSPSNDSNGFADGGSSGRNISFNKVIGDDPLNLTGKTVNTMDDYGSGVTKEGDGCSWKSSGCASIDGVLYWLVARHHYGGDVTIDGDKRQKAHGASFIKSTDRGRTWTRSKQENYDHPMFPGNRFAAPYFIQYGQDGYEPIAVDDASDKYVYALSNNGFWDNGDWVVLGRCLRAKMPELNAADWQFYTQGDGAKDAAWTSNLRDAKAVLCNPDHLGMTRAVYLPKHRCYLMIGWYYPAGGGSVDTPDGKSPHARSTWDFYVAPHPWGPWRTVGSHEWAPLAFYCPGVCPKFNSADESTVWALMAGDWQNGAAYKLTTVPLTIK